MTNEQLWQAALGELELLLSKANFTTWFKQTFISMYEGERVTVGVPNAFTKSWLENKYHKSILKALQNITDQKVVSVEYKIESLKSFEQRSNWKQPKKELTEVLPEPYQNERESIKEFSMNPRYTFESFVVGSTNELAHAAALAVVEHPGSKYNPLFLYGGVGLGKTHLMQAVGQAIKHKQPTTNVLYVNFEKFTNDYVAATKQGTFEQFRRVYRSADVFLVDDVQFMVNKEKTQEEFFHTFEALHQQNKQIVVTSDGPPKSLLPLQDRLISRFEWGMIADLQAPDKEMRLAILQTKCEEKKFTLTDDIQEYMATYIQSNVRELEGALNKIIAWHQLNGEESTLESVKKIMTSLVVNPSRGALTSRKIVDTVAAFYEIQIKDLVGASRKKDLVMPRQIAMFLMREEMKNSYPAIGQDLGGRDHTTAMHACAKIERNMGEDERLRQDVATIKQRLYQH